ncbi:MAG: hypothetical protein KBC78_04330 [Candidatus Pacebacteria bacterium]|nr:hypothetical protein [Candidatus Paceibacterota bacterium]
MFELPPDLAEIRLHEQAGRVMHFGSRYRFLQAINGLRPGCIHGLLAPSSMGKSTLLRSIISDTSEIKKVGVILSEETDIEYSSGFERQGEPICWENLLYASESKIVSMYDTKEEQLDAIISFAIENDIKVLFWDNITTGGILGDTVMPNQMAVLLDRLKKNLFLNQIALMFIAHTNKSVKTEQSFQFQGEDVRGSAQYYLKSDYFFTLQTKTKEDKKITFVKIAKHRFHQPKDIYYVLPFEVNRYVKDTPVKYSLIQEIFEKEKKKDETPRKSYQLYSRG